MATFRKRGTRWQAIVRRRGVTESQSFDRRADAAAWARAIEREVDMGGVVPSQNDDTLASIIERYEREAWATRRWGHSKASALRQLAQDLGKLRLHDVTKPALVKYMASLTIAPGTITQRMSYLRVVLATARDLWGMAAPVDALDAALSIGRQQKLVGRALVRTRRPTADELTRIIALAESRTNTVIDLGAIVRVLSVLPFRVGELVGIQWDDIDALARTVVLRQRKHPDRRIKESSVDVVALPVFAGVDTFALVADRPRYLPSPFPYSANSVTAAFARETLRLGIKDLHLHDLRAHAVSVMLERQVPIPQVALLSGHRNWKILQRNYSRITPESVHEVFKDFA